MNDQAPKELETRLLDMWRATLDNDRLTADDNFFVEGGDSMLALRLLAAVRSEFGLPHLSVRSIFRHPTAAQFAAFLAGEVAKTSTVDS